MKSKMTWLALFALASVVFLASHKSSQPRILSRYSALYFTFLATYSAGLAAAFWLYRSRHWQSLCQGMRRLDFSDFSAHAARHYAGSVAAIHVFHAVLVFLFISPRLVFSAEPILSSDYAHHFHQVASVVEALAGAGRHWALDFSFCAGYPVGALFDVDMKLVEILAFVLTRLGVALPLAYNCLILLFFLAPPVLLFASCRNFRLPPDATILVMAAGVLLWHSDLNLVGFNAYGMFAFVFAVYWTILTVSIFHRFIERPGAASTAALAAALALGLHAHITMPLLAAPPMLTLYVLSFRKMSPAGHGLAVLAASLALALNAWWIATVAQFLPFRVATTFWAAPSISSLIEVLLYFGSPELVLGLLGVWGYSLHRTSARVVSLMGMASIAGYFFLANMAGGVVPWFNSLEPRRFTVALAVFSVVGVALGAARLLSGRRLGRMSYRTGFPVLLILLFYFGNLLAPRSTGRFHGEQEFLQPLVEWIRENTTREARIAFLDDSPGSLTGAKLRYFVDRELVGGPFSQMNLKHSYASFTPYRFFDKRLAELTEDDFGRYADRYNIRWLVTSTDQACAIFSVFSATAALVERMTLQSEEKWGSEALSPFERYRSRKGEFPICIFELEREPSFFLHGSGRAAATLNRIAVTEASPGRVVLKYHWSDTMAVSPVLPIREHRVPGAPIGFIEIDNGTTTEFVVYNSYRR